jgi:hypothetical protein
MFLPTAGGREEQGAVKRQSVSPAAGNRLLEQNAQEPAIQWCR